MQHLGLRTSHVPLGLQHFGAQTFNAAQHFATWVHLGCFTFEKRRNREKQKSRKVEKQKAETQKRKETGKQKSKRNAQNRKTSNSQKITLQIT